MIHSDHRELKILGLEVMYLNAIGAFMYLANGTQFDISFSLDPLVRLSSSPTQKHWNVIKTVFHYLQEIIKVILF